MTTPMSPGGERPGASHRAPDSAPDCAPPPDTPATPDTGRLPAGTCDSHLHVFGPQATYPLDPRRSYTPHVCSLDDYRRVMAALGISRAVLVQPSVYGTDNSALLDALRAGGPAFRGVAVPPADASDAQLQAMHALGVRGIRLNLVNPQVLGVQDALSLCQRMAGSGWHLQVQLDLARGGADTLQALCGSAGLPVVVDHMGRLAPDMPDHTLLDLLANGRCWVKLSAPYRVSAEPAPHPGLTRLVRQLVAANPEQVLWGSDWPHTEQLTDTPEAAALADLLHAWLPDAPALRRVCVDNPARLYHYPPHPPIHETLT